MTCFPSSVSRDSLLNLLLTRPFTAACHCKTSILRHDSTLTTVLRDVVPANTLTVFVVIECTWGAVMWQCNALWKPTSSQGSWPFVGCYRTGGASMLKEHGETPTLAGLREAVLRLLCHWDLWLPLETLPALPRRQLQGKATVSGHAGHCPH